jgi:molybdenum cofactor biosynthesis protein MoaC
MIDITHKIKTLRRAVAGAVVKVSRQETIDAVINKTVPKGDVFEMAKTAGLFAVKKTSDIIPDCHPLPVEYTGVKYKIEGLEIYIEIEVATIYRTGVEVEAMHGASVIALTMYDMLKPIDKGIEIHSIKLLEKKGGKTAFADKSRGFTASVIVCSDTISKGKKEDKAGKVICDKLAALEVDVKEYKIIPDEIDIIKNEVNAAVQQGRHYVMITGGTGLSPRDVTPEAVIPLLDREIPGIMEAARAYGQERTPYAMLSRGVAGTTNGAKETMDALFPYLLHLNKIMSGGRHDQDA